MAYCSHLGTKLDDGSIRTATGLRLGANIVEEHNCICGSIVDRTEATWTQLQTELCMGGYPGSMLPMRPFV